MVAHISSSEIATYICRWLLFLFLNVPLVSLCLYLCPQLRSLQGRGRATTRPWACWPRSLWVWSPSLPTEFLTWTGPPRSWRSRRGASMTSPTSWRECSSSERSLRTTYSGCEYQRRRPPLLKSPPNQRLPKHLMIGGISRLQKDGKPHVCGHRPHDSLGSVLYTRLLTQSGTVNRLVSNSPYEAQICIYSWSTPN